ncbi:MAG: flagellar biosynthesis anti-sigma factor FlgM [Desulfobacteraceae bacterium]|nr:MAG: flagellar biosynthesis anti-sigma factor FlgM [Desulfobacteraceae bacterium]
MKISGRPPAAHPLDETSGQSSRAVASKSLPPAAPRDRVHLSAAAHQLQAAREALRHMPEVDLDKVAEIKARLKEGRYTADPQKIASKILEESLLKELE